MLNAKVLSDFFKKKLKFFEKNPNALIRTGWSWYNDAFDAYDSEWYVNVNGETFWISYNENGKPPLVAWTKPIHQSDEEYEGGRAFFLKRLKHFTAEHFARRGYSYWDVLWAMSELLDSNGNVVGDQDWWFINPVRADEVPHAEKYKAELRRRKEQIALRAEMRDWALAHGVEVVRRVTCEYTCGTNNFVVYNLLNGTYTGYNVAWCFSSQCVAGDCTCVKQGGGKEIAGEMTRLDFEKAKDEYFYQLRIMSRESSASKES